MKTKLRSVIVSQNHYLNKILDVLPLETSWPENRVIPWIWGLQNQSWLTISFLIHQKKDLYQLASAHFQWSAIISYKVGPIEDRSSTDQLDHFAKLCDMWYVTCDMWHITCDMWRITHREWWTLSQNVKSLALMVCDLCELLI